jgi:hypothetical protein
MADRSEGNSPKGNAPSAWFGFGLTNVGILLLAVLVIVFGYILLDRGSVTAAPILLVLGYMVLLPAGLLFGFRRLDR